jgi:DNA (cytosine-5)-methyltransferase 1
VDGFPRAIPQRRRRVFLVGYIGDWRRAAEVLFEPKSLLGDTPPGRTKRQGFASGAGGCVEKADGFRESSYGAFADGNESGTLKAVGGVLGGGSETLVKQQLATGNFGIAQVEDDMEQQVYDARGNGDGKTANTITCDNANRVTDFTPIIAQADGFKPRNSSSARSLGYENNNSPTIDTSQNVAIVVHGSQDPISNTEHTNAVNRNNGLENCVCELEIRKSTPCESKPARPCLSVRRLMPIECERLFGFPDNWTKIPWRGKPAEECPDTPRYKACGNSMGVNCMRWIGLGIEAVEAKHRK